MVLRIVSGFGKSIAIIGTYALGNAMIASSFAIDIGR